MSVDLLNKLKANPDNPRYIDKEEFERLLTKIKTFPQMLEKRPIVYDENHIVLGGNQRLQALKKLATENFEIKDEYFKSAEGWTDEEKKKFVIWDNVSEGGWDYDILANKWDDLPLEEWGVMTLNDEKDEELSNEYSQNVGEVIYQPKETNHKPEDLFEAEHKFDEDIKHIENETIREMLQARVAYFSKFNFAKIADYYAYQATKKEKKIFEKLALVLLDKDKLIENGFSKIIDVIGKEMPNEEKD